MGQLSFAHVFQQLTGHPPFPWQQALYDDWFAKGNIPPSCNLPTGLGKTAVIAVWLIALANGAKLPRRLVYVVNRRTVVDQTTAEVENYRTHLRQAGLDERLRALYVAGPQANEFPLAISTLRGQFADNREWSADPSRPAVICGTVDMIGSRLLFSGYGVGGKAKPLHAGFLGQDTLLIHDEAHLEPAFQKLLEAIRDEQRRCPDYRPLHVMELTATSRGHIAAFGLTDADNTHEVVRQRIKACKKLHLHALADPKKVAEELAKKAKTFADKNRAVVVFARTVEDVLKIAEKLPTERVLTLTGTMRGRERDRLVEEPIFRRFLPEGFSNEPTVYLVCTAAGEVGVNISADDLICDLTPFDSMAQRLGRVNRFGLRAESEVHVYHPTAFDDTPYEQARQQTLQLLTDLNGEASPEALNRLDVQRRQAAFTPPPLILPVTESLFDAWALTTIREPLPGRPAVEPYLHGLPTEWQPPETQVAWREEVALIQGDVSQMYQPADILDAYPLKPHEWLKEPSYRAFKHLATIAQRYPEAPVWLVDDSGTVEVLTLAQLTTKDNKERIEGKTVLLPPYVGGLTSQGLLDGSAEAPTEGSLDIADIPGERVRVWSDDEQFEAKTAGMHALLTITFSTADDEDAEERRWEWFTRRNEGDKSAQRPVLWEIHVADVVRQAERIVAGLELEPALASALRTAAQYHDHGKRRKLFQQVLGNAHSPQRWLAKSGRRSLPVPETYRHEFGSLLDVDQELTGEHRDLVLHLIAAHHGRARPHFPQEEVFDPDRPQALAERMAAEVPRRFARLQRQYGRWGLAYLESLLRAADWAASANPSQFVDDEG
ncbi:MAG: type I-U CRISPR-associated helicase/endonuclease Cas3 [Gemmataceae bacterium]|nr:type I-U CRISPR-associated helicase/endonuclease Cas3 [Gemmata sp.]MDW8196879.1 type I-U CRISPR-associated helicase/endonuclease Cas3 [Gemmataceae bacterium]